jgi:hypothetical protein
MNNDELLKLRGGYNVFCCEERQFPGGYLIDPDFCFSFDGGLLAATRQCAEFYQTFFPGATCICD